MADDFNDMKKIPQGSAIKRSSFSQFMSSLFGFRKSTKGGNSIEFTQVDLGSDEKTGQALLGNSSVYSVPLSEKLEALFDRWLTDNTNKYEDLRARQDRINQLGYAVLNDPFMSRVVNLYADEATQLDAQDTLFQIETPDPKMTKDMYGLITQWGITQQRVHATFKQLATYGDAFWSNKISEKGVESIRPLPQMTIADRLEFNPARVLEDIKRQNGGLNSLASNNYLIQTMLKDMEELQNENGTYDVSTIFDTKLFGFVLDSDLTVPPWSITHFRVDADGGEFYPFGTSPILGALSSYKQTQSAIALQQIARQMSFPITVFNVKTSENMDIGKQFSVVNRVREQFDNIGINSQVGNSEVYTYNTKIWAPSGLIDVSVEDPAKFPDGVNDIDLYQKRTAVSCGLPQSFAQSFYEGSGFKSARALVEQFKPFARETHTLQTSFTNGLSDLFRIHFAITGMYDFRIPFTISMRFPALESEDENKINQASLEFAGEIVKVIKGIVGVEEDENLPPDILRDIFSKYSFIDAGDIMKWTKDAQRSVNMDISGGGGSGNDFGELGGDLEEPDIDLGGDEIDLNSKETKSEPASDSIDLETTDVESEVEESIRIVNHLKKLKEKEIKESRIREKYYDEKDRIYFEILKEKGITSFNRNGRNVNVYSTIPTETELMLEVLSTGGRTSSKLKESEKPSKNRKKKIQNK